MDPIAEGLASLHEMLGRMQQAMARIVIVDHTGKFAQAELDKVAAALTVQAQRDFSLPPPYGYGIGAQVRAASPASPAKPDEWVLGLFDHPDQPGALGRHDRTAAGLPLLKVFPFIDPTSPWSAIASHEVLEALEDSELCKVIQSPVDGQMHADEVCDAVEQDSYLINGVAVSNFVTPCFFAPPANMTGLKYDFMGLVTEPLEIRPGGYDQVYTDEKGWTQILADKRSAYRTALDEAGVATRGARRELVPTAVA